MPNNILLIIEGTYPWYRGGVSEWTYQYLLSCKDINFNVLQIATDEFQALNPKEALYPLTDNILNFIRISPPEMSDNWQKDSTSWYDSVSAEVQELANVAGCIHVTNTGFAGWIGAKIASKMDKPLVLTEHAIYWEEIEKGAVALECGYKIPDTLAAKEHVVQVFRDIAKEVYTAADNVISVSRYNLDRQKQLGATNPKYIPNGIPANVIIDAKTRANNPVIGWVGRCAEMKNPKLFFDFIAEFETLDISPQFVMMLSDANEKELEKEVRELADNFTDVEMIWNQSAIEHMHKLDMLCITSHNESQPLVLFEALANKALPIGWKVGDVDTEFAFVVNKGVTIKKFAQEVKNLWNDRTLFNEMIEGRHQKVKEEHNWTFIFNKYQEIFKKHNYIKVLSN